MTVTVRPATRNDAGAVQAIYAPFVADTGISFELDVPDVAEMERRIGEVIATLPWLVAETDEGVVGYAYADLHGTRWGYQWSVDASVYVRESSWGRGIGTALYRELIRIVAGLGYVSVYAGIALPNEASVRLHESVGFRHIGTFESVGYKRGVWWDVGWWALPLRDPSARPDAPRSWRPAT